MYVWYTFPFFRVVVPEVALFVVLFFFPNCLSFAYLILYLGVAKVL